MKGPAVQYITVRPFDKLRANGGVLVAMVLRKMIYIPACATAV
jgi:hypothetical protein